MAGVETVPRHDAAVVKAIVFLLFDAANRRAQSCRFRPTQQCKWRWWSIGESRIEMSWALGGVGRSWNSGNSGQPAANRVWMYTFTFDTDVDGHKSRRQAPTVMNLEAIARCGMSACSRKTQAQ